MSREGKKEDVEGWDDRKYHLSCMNERINFFIIISNPNSLRVRLEYIDVAKGTVEVSSIVIPPPEKKVVPMQEEDESTADWKQIHAETHLLRLRIGIALQRIL